MGCSPGAARAEVIPGRLAAVHLATLAKEGVVAYPVYLWPSEGLSNRNLAVLHALAEHASSHGKAWIAGGGWNLEPDVLCGAKWPEKLGAYIKAVNDPLGTCNKSFAGSNIDYFVFDKRLKFVV